MMVTEADGQNSSFHPVLKIAAKVVSYIFHPLFIPVYVGYFFIYILRIFPQLTDWDKTKLLISFTVNYTVLPLVTILLTKGLGFINSIYLKTQKDRIIPYVASITYYFWAFYVSRNLPGNPAVMTFFFLGTFLAVSAALMCAGMSSGPSVVWTTHCIDASSDGGTSRRKKASSARQVKNRLMGAQSRNNAVHFGANAV